MVLFGSSSDGLDGLTTRLRLDVRGWADCDIVRLDNWPVARPRGLKNGWRKVEKVESGKGSASFGAKQMKMAKVHLGRPERCRNAAAVVLLTRTV